MKKSKHFRKDVILARIIAAIILLVLIGLLVFGISLLEKPSDENKDSQNSQNTENLLPGYQDTQDEGTEEDVPPTENQGEEGNTTGTEENNNNTDVPDKVYIKTTVTSLRLREEPNTSCATLDRIPEGTKLEVIEQVDIWYKVSYNGKVGYVSSTYVEVVEE